MAEQPGETPQDDDVPDGVLDPPTQDEQPDDGGGADGAPGGGAGGGGGPPGLTEEDAGSGVGTEGMPDPPELEDV